MKKVTSYVLMILGLAIVALSYKPVRDLLNITLPTAITETYLIIAGVILAAIGAFLLRGQSSSKHKISEVPIYHGKDVVGFRRIKNK